MASGLYLSQGINTALYDCISSSDCGQTIQLCGHVPLFMQYVPNLIAYISAYLNYMLLCVFMVYPSVVYGLYIDHFFNSS